MGIADLTGPRAKLGRANEHLKAFHEELRTFGEQEAKVATTIFERAGAWHVLKVGPIPAVPSHIALVIGDCLNNLRAALDHLVWQLVLREDQEPGQSHSFPIYDTREEFINKVETPAKRGKQGSPLYGIPINGDAWTLVEAAQPFNRPEPQKEALTLLAQLTKIDKHRMLLVQRAYPHPEKFFHRLRWQDDLQPIWQHMPMLALSAEHPTQLAWFLFPPEANPRIDIQGDLPLEPSGATVKPKRACP